MSSIERSGARLVCDVVVPKVYLDHFEGREAMEGIFNYDGVDGFEEFLKGYEDAQIHTLEDLIRYNNEHAAEELPAGKDIVCV